MWENAWRGILAGWGRGGESVADREVHGEIFLPEKGGGVQGDEEVQGVVVV